jgi:hypothetical protein
MLSSITSESIQRWTRIVLYYIFGAVGYGGVQSGFDWRPIVVSGVGFGLTALWTKYGSTVGAMLTEVEKTDGVKEIEVKVDPKLVSPRDLNAATPDAVVVKSST